VLTNIAKLEEPTTSRIFLNQISVVDHAYIDDKGCVRGGSFNPNFIVAGKPDDVEKVVVDFSTIKKDIKKVIDQHLSNPLINGYDHKLWVIEGYSVINEYVPDNYEMVHIETPSLKIDLPSNAVRYISRVESKNPSHHLDYIGAAFTELVQRQLSQLYPLINVETQCVNTVDEHLTFNVETRPFHYVHGLKDSTSYGCQNIAHGHRSYIHTDIEIGDVRAPVIRYLLTEIAAELDDTVFVRQDNVIATDNDTITIGYSTTQRGRFNLVLNTEKHKIVVLPTETTVEFLAAYVKMKYGDQLRNAGVTTVYISEGLSKGAVELLQ
jgi:hypothetical protein